MIAKWLFLISPIGNIVACPQSGAHTAKAVNAIKAVKAANRNAGVDAGRFLLRSQRNSAPVLPYHCAVVEHGSDVDIVAPSLTSSSFSVSSPSPTRSDKSGILLRQAEAGSAVVAHVLVSILVVAIVAALLQLALGLHIRNLLIDAASEGARMAGRENATMADGLVRANQIIDANLGAGFMRRLSISTTSIHPHAPGQTIIEMHISARLPVLGFWGPASQLNVTGHGLKEDPSA